MLGNPPRERLLADVRAGRPKTRIQNCIHASRKCCVPEKQLQTSEQLDALKLEYKIVSMLRESVASQRRFEPPTQGLGILKEGIPI